MDIENPLTFLLILVGIFFALWLVGGGPHRAISFSGPYITPITDIGDTQSGYGPQINPDVNVSLPGGASARVTSKAAPASDKKSSYAASISIARSSVASDQNPNHTYIELLLTNHSDSAVTLSNWKLVSTPGTFGIRNGSTNSVTLAAHQSALIVTNYPSGSSDPIKLYDGSGALVGTAQ